MARDLDPDFPLFVGGFVALFFFLGAAAAYLTGPDQPALVGLSTALAGLGTVFVAVGAFGAVVLWWLGR
jgi:hypothetical protein